MSANFEVILILALPASGKSEVRKYLSSLPPDVQKRDFHFSESVQLDDYPYVHMARRISQETRLMGVEPAFFLSDAHSLKEPKDWGTLVELVNQDYRDLVALKQVNPANPAGWLLDRYDAARVVVGAAPAFSGLSADVRGELERRIDKDARKVVADKNEGIPTTLEDKTIVIEFARGGPDGSTLPLPAPFGYRHSLSVVAPEILAKAAILYVWVDPAESRRKNIERTDPNDPGSILNHGVPLSIMYYDYGCDDMAWLIEQSDRPDTVKIDAHGKTWHLPVARFDNRVDRTTFVRKPKSEWTPERRGALQDGLTEAFQKLSRAYDAR